ncbi:GNAT family N-acetyltransferase [Streptomyces triticirhizae]|uniref:GNAT family N-acetyltransferase n=1 Tax=Streptomyces triticirhizae TaxID=2483353 RepID=A0A3M2LT36_9ACTN|nr:GNAT family N-acetyltransferase [Streptomyces triticirhizae]RMI39743.1 GNAT family N-acetyltransferase [Streptomyces triticirhizae]
MIISEANPADLPLLLEYRQEAARWLGRAGIDQWSNDFPEQHVLESIRSGTVYLVRDHSGPTATVTLDDTPEPDLWTEDELSIPSTHLHKLIVSRRNAGRGIGGQILNWASDRAAREGKVWIRINAWSTNNRLHRYWESQGFTHIRTVAGGGVGGAGVAGWLAQRPARRCHHLLIDRTSAAQLR